MLSIVGRKTMVPFEVGGWTLPPGVHVTPCIYLTHRRADLWEQPTAFRPERFTPERVRARHRYAHIPFSAGPRACIGKRYALYELSTALALILTRFRIDVLPGQDVGIRPTATVHPDRPIYAHLRGTGR